MPVAAEIRQQISSVGAKMGERYRRRTGIPGEIRVGSEAFNIRAVEDFPPNDPWTEGMREVLIANAEKFSGRPLIEFGIGDGRNPFAIIKRLMQQGLPRPTKVVGIELDGWRKRLASKNLENVKGETPNELVKADAVKWVESALQNEEELSGTAILCLPQAPLVEKASEGRGRRRLRKISTADGYSEKDLPEYAQKWNQYGLGLNSAVLNGLSAVTDQDFRAFAMFSERIPQDKLAEMLTEAGWEIAQSHRLGFVQQDPDTPVTYTQALDQFPATRRREDALFFEKVSDTEYEPIAAEEAERRRIESMTSGRGRDGLNVYHGLVVVELTKRDSEPDPDSADLLQPVYATSN